MHGRVLDARHAHLKLRGPHLAITCALHQILKHGCTTSTQQLIHLQCRWVECMSMDACAAMGEHRREHTRERSDGQAQMAENRPNAHATRSAAAYLVGIRVLVERAELMARPLRHPPSRPISQLMTKMTPASFWFAPFPSPGCWYLVGELASRAIPQTRSVANPTGIDRPEGPTATGGPGATIGRNGGLGHVTSGGVRSVAF